MITYVCLRSIGGGLTSEQCVSMSVLCLRAVCVCVSVVCLSVDQCSSLASSPLPSQHHCRASPHSTPFTTSSTSAPTTPASLLSISSAL
eukprot:3846130-Rhodomonas_salina.1